MWPPPRSAMPSHISRARIIGARRLTSSARSISSTVSESIAPLPGRPALATRTSTGPASSTSRATAARSLRSHATRAPAGLGGERLEHLDAPPGEDQSAPRAHERAGDRLPQPAARARHERRPSPEIHGHTLQTGRQTRSRSRWEASGEDGDRGREAVQERLAADRADLAGGEEPAAGAPASSSATASASWSPRPNSPRPRPLHENSSAPAGGRPPSARHADAERLAEVAVGAVGVARVQPHDLARAHVGGDRDLAGRRVGAHQPAHEEVALHVLGLVRRRPRSPSAARPGRARGPWPAAPRSSRAASRAPACPPARG